MRHGDGTELHLTSTEFRLLTDLATVNGKVLSREDLLERVWGYDYFGDSRLVDVHIRRLRMKIEPDPANPMLPRDRARRGVQVGALVRASESSTSPARHLRTGRVRRSVRSSRRSPTSGSATSWSTTSSSTDLQQSLRQRGADPQHPLHRPADARRTCSTRSSSATASNVLVRTHDQWLTPSPTAPSPPTCSAGDRRDRRRGPRRPSRRMPSTARDLRRRRADSGGARPRSSRSSSSARLEHTLRHAARCCSAAAALSRRPGRPGRRALGVASRGAPLRARSRTPRRSSPKASSTTRLLVTPAPTARSSS